MPDGLSLVILAAAGLAFWLGTFLLARGPGDPRLRYAGLGLAGYALALSVLGLHTGARPELQVTAR